MATTTATVAVTTSADGTRYSAEDPDLIFKPIASLTKVVTAWVARRWVVTAGQLDTTVTVTATEYGSTANLKVGDVISYRDLFYGMMLPSGNDAAKCIAENVGATILASEGTPGDAAAARSRFYTEMEAATAADLGWSGQVFRDSWGLHSLNAMSVAQLCQIMHDIDTNDAWLRGVMGALQHVGTIAGPNARTVTWTHTIDPDGAVALPEFVAGKTGTVGTTAGVAILWDNPNDGARYATALHGSTPADRFTDLRALMDERVAGTTPVDPPDPDPSPSGLFRTSGAAVTLASADGTPVTLA